MEGGPTGSRGGGDLAAARRLLRPLAPALGILVLQQVLFPAPSGILLRGVVVGGLTALLALGMALIYRANRFVNFAQADLGFAPAVLAFLLLDEVGVPWPVAVVVGLAAAAGVGATTERLVVRRFFRSPRLLVTVASLGLSQVLAAAALLLPRLWDRRLVSDRIPQPFDTSARVGGVVFDTNDLLALLVTPALVALVAWLLHATDAGVAIRASADDPDRAALLGVPVQHLHTVVWAGAALLAFVTMFLRGGILGLPPGTELAFGVLLRALVALLLGRLTDLVAVTTSAVALGVLELAISWDDPVGLIDPVLGLIVLVALVLRRPGSGPAEEDDSATWQGGEEVRPLPGEVAARAEVRTARWLLPVALAGGAALLATVLPVDDSLRASALLIYAVLGLSLVLLSGWAGHVSLGQIGFFAVGAAACAWVTARQGGDLFAGLVLGALAGAAAAALLAVPARRLRGLSLAITTFAASLAATSFLADGSAFDWLTLERVERAPLLGGLEVATPTEVFLLALAALVLVALAVRGIRASRTGRALVALRENPRAAEAYGIDAARTRVVAFALSGGIAGLAGALFVHHQQAYDVQSFSPVQGLAVFTMVVVGGLTSVTGALLGALFLLGTQWFLPADWRVLASGTGVLAVLWLAPGGLASLPFRLRDRWLRRTVAGAGADPDAAPAPPPAPAPPAEGGEAPVLAVRGLAVSYGSVRVLDGVDLAVAPGEAVALLGTNGAGKSTLLRAVTGLLPPAAGTVTLDGHDVTRTAPHVLARRGLVQVPGGRGVFPSLTVAENLRVAGWLHRRSAAEPDDGTGGGLGGLFPGLHERRTQRAGTLSGGQQQLLALAMGARTRPRVLLIDELSLGLAPVVVEELVAVVEELRRRGTTLLLVDQSVEVALRVARRAVFLERGTVRFRGPTPDLLERPDLLRSVFLGGDGRSGPATPRRTADGATGAAAADAGGPPVLEAVGLRRGFGGVRAVDGVSLTVGRGEIVGVIGPNGAGKTTLFDLLSGFTRPEEGAVRLGGRDVTRWSASARARAGLGRSFQDARLFPSLTVEETVAAACEREVRVRDPLSAALRLPPAVDSERAVARRVDELLERLGLVRYRSAFVGELSTGTRRVVDLACLLAHRPDVVLLDEPAAGIAAREVDALAPLLRRLRDEAGASLVVVDHDVPLVESVADRIVALHEGRVVTEGAPEAVLRHPEVVASYLGTRRRESSRAGA